MAKKIIEVPKEEQNLAPVEEQAQVPVEEQTIEEVKNVVSEETVKEKEIPEFVRRILKIYSNYDELYIDAKGGVYTKGTQPSAVGSAILYKNPYFNS